MVYECFRHMDVYHTLEDWEAHLNKYHRKSAATTKGK